MAALSSRQCLKCGRRYPSSYRKCPYCAGEARRRQARPVDRLLTALRPYRVQIFAVLWLVFFSIAVIGFLATRCSGGADDPPKDVASPPPVQVTPKPLAISRTDAALTEGEVVDVTVTGGFDTLIWTSSDESVATVENGRVTGVAAGTATITASTGVESVSCQVTVQAAPPAVKLNLALNRTDFTLRAKDPPFQMKVLISGTKTAYDGEVVWGVQDPKVASISETGLVERVGRGTTTVTASANGQTLECIVRVS